MESDDFDFINRILASGGYGYDVPRRDVNGLTVGELVRRSSDEPRHIKRPAITIEGVTKQETLKERFTREVSELEDALVGITSKLADRRRQLEHLSRFPDEDPFADGTTLFFEKTFPHSPDKAYEYAAVRTNDRYHVTGTRSPQNATWAELVHWMGLGVKEVYTLKRSGKGFIKAIG